MIWRTQTLPHCPTDDPQDTTLTALATLLPTDDLQDPTLLPWPHCPTDWWSAGPNLGHIVPRLMICRTQYSLPWPHFTKLMICRTQLWLPWLQSPHDWWSAGHRLGKIVLLSDDLQDTTLVALATLSPCLMIYKTQHWLPWPHCPNDWWSTGHNLHFLGHILPWLMTYRTQPRLPWPHCTPDWWSAGPSLGYIVPMTNDPQIGALTALATLSPWLMIHRTPSWLTWLHCPHDWWSTGPNLDYLGHIVHWTDDLRELTLAALTTLYPWLMIHRTPRCLPALATLPLVWLPPDWWSNTTLTDWCLEICWNNPVVPNNPIFCKFQHCTCVMIVVCMMRHLYKPWNN